MKIKDIMTREVVTVGQEVPLKQVAGLLIEKRISGMPVVGADGQVLGVVSETDIVRRGCGNGNGSEGGLLAHLFRRHREVEAKLHVRTAGDAMTSPAVAVRPDTSVAEAASLLVEREINRLVVLDDGALLGEATEGRLVGIVTRADFVRAFARSDREIAAEIEDIVFHQYWIPASQITLDVDQGEVTLGGEVDLRGTAEMLADAVARVPGVLSVRSDLHWRAEDERLSRA